MHHVDVMNEEKGYIQRSWEKVLTSQGCQVCITKLVQCYWTRAIISLNI